MFGEPNSFTTNVSAARLTGKPGYVREMASFGARSFSPAFQQRLLVRRNGCLPSPFTKYSHSLIRRVLFWLTNEAKPSILARTGQSRNRLEIDAFAPARRAARNT